MSMVQTLQPGIVHRFWEDGMDPIADIAGLRALFDYAEGGSDEIRIAVVDGPVDLSHPCFAGADLTTLDTLGLHQTSSGGAAEHATHVASVIFGQRGSSVSGIAPSCSGLTITIYRSGEGKLQPCSQLDLARAIDQAVASGAHVINISGGELTATGEAETLLAQAIRRCTESGVLMVAAAGNNGCPCIHIPAAVPSVLAVGAMDLSGSPLASSNWGSVYQEQGVLAYGQNVVGAVPGGGVAEKSGTSSATAVVSGIAALLLTLQLKRGEKPDPQMVRTALLETAEPCDPQAWADCRPLLAGRLTVPAAHAKIGRGSRGKIASQLPNPADCPIQTRKSFQTRIDEGTTPIPPPVVPARSGVTNVNIDNHLAVEENQMSDENRGSETVARQAGNGHTIAPEAPRDILAAERPGIPGEPAPLILHPHQAERATRMASSTLAVLPSGLEPAECASCAAANASPSLGYALGQIGYDFGTEARRDSFLQLTNRNVHDSAELLEYLRPDPASAANIIWTLSLDATVIYAVQPFGPFANVAYDRMREFLAAQLTEGVERVSVPGYITGSVKLMNGQQVPVIYPEVRGMCSWNTPNLVKAVLGEPPTEAEARERHAQHEAGIRNFLDRVYYEIRNLGMTPQERAMNYAATNAFQLGFVYADAIKAELKLDNIGVERSPICRPGSDCWDVKLMFFNPVKRLEQARRAYRFTVDVSDVVPVTVGNVRHWDVY